MPSCPRLTTPRLIAPLASPPHPTLAAFHPAAAVGAGENHTPRALIDAYLATLDAELRGAPRFARGPARRAATRGKGGGGNNGQLVTADP